ncbi:hypothetical protein [Oceanobacillus sp. FSL W7-1309]|uniref:hypothetical protein n=1 Tax=Oceanobacillus sp. FSL W7-1309 TaxID=2954539 RepID=UPI0030F667DC
MKLEITGINLKGHNFPIPDGLDELLNNNNGWGVKDEDLNNQYERKVIKSNEGLITKLKLIGS